MWVVDHLADLDADFRRFYGIAGVGDEEFGDLSGPRFLALAYRVGAYGGVMTLRAEEERQDTSGGWTPAERLGPDVRVPPEWLQGDVEVVDARTLDL